MPVKRVVTWIFSSQLEGAARVYFGGKTDANLIETSGLLLVGSLQESH